MSTQTTATAEARTTRQDWLQVAFDILLSEGVENVKVLSIAKRLNCARSSFYWFFDNKEQLLDVLLKVWAALNTDAIVSRAAAPADTIARATLNVFECWSDNNIFDVRLDFAVREWARRSVSVRAAVDAADDQRVAAVCAMFERFGFDQEEAFIRARTLYFMQIGYFALDVRESVAQKLTYLATYVYCFTGQQPEADDVARFSEWALGVEKSGSAGGLTRALAQLEESD